MSNRRVIDSFSSRRDSQGESKNRLCRRLVSLRPRIEALGAASFYRTGTNAFVETSAFRYVAFRLVAIRLLPLKTGVRQF